MENDAAYRQMDPPAPSCPREYRMNLPPWLVEELYLAPRLSRRWLHLMDVSASVLRVNEGCVALNTPEIRVT